MGQIKRGVSLYSYQQAQFFKELDLEAQIREVGTNLYGADGIEMLDEQSLRRYPNPPADFFKHWFEWMEKYGTTPVTMDVFCDVLQFRDHEVVPPFLKSDTVMSTNPYHRRLA